MKIKDIHILAIIVRLFALFLMVKAFISGSDMLFSLANQSWLKFSVSYLIYPISTLLIVNCLDVISNDCGKRNIALY
jgi:hypothetical protein